MRKLLIGILAIGIFLGAVSNSFAILTKEYARGRVISVDYQKSEVVVLEETTKNEMIFKSKRIDPGVAVGVRVLVIYKGGTNEATVVKPTRK